MEVLPTVIEAEYRGGYLITLKFNDGVEQTVDFEQWLEGPAFEPLKDISYFQKFFIEGGLSHGRTEQISPRRRFMS